MPIPEQLGPFRLKKLLGKGGMGAVYLAEHEGVPHPVALKVLLSQADGDPVRRGRFETEIETLRRLRQHGQEGVGVVHAFEMCVVVAATRAFGLEVIDSDNQFLSVVDDRIHKGFE